MTLKIEVGAVLRAVRQLRGMSYDNMKDVSANSTISLLERAESAVTVGKLSEIAEALDFDFIAFMALCVAIQREESPLSVLADAYGQIQVFQEAGGQELITAQIDGKSLSRRSRGKPSKKDNLVAVQKLKAAGKSQAEAVRQLGLPRSTVHRYWHQT